MKSCELCKFPARTYCESDQASLCWDCDAKVHGANFLVARHWRCLLCQTCQSPTPWRAAGAKLGRTVSACKSCVSGGEGAESEAENEDDEMSNTADDESVEDGDDDDDDGDADEEDGDNQVVPWSSVCNTPPPASSSSSIEESGSDRQGSESVKAFSLKRGRENASDLHTKDLLSLMPSDDLNSSSPQQKYGTTLGSPCRLEDEVVISADTMRSWKRKHQRMERDIPVHFQSSAISPPAISPLKRFESKNLRKESRSFDLNT